LGASAVGDANHGGAHISEAHPQQQWQGVSEEGQAVWFKHKNKRNTCLRCAKGVQKNAGFLRLIRKAFSASEEMNALP
jgi:hypothetical protein